MNGSERPKFLYSTVTGEACILGPDGKTKYYLVSEVMYRQLKELIDQQK